MARALRIEYPGANYHITSRGNERKSIYRNKGDRRSFLLYLKSAYLRYGAVIHAYCLMDNHYHILLETPRGNLSQIMRHINGAYTTRFNVKHKRKGHLFQGRYKAILVDADAYLTELSRYIHLNPVRAGMVDMPEKYSWSSYRYYIGKKKKPDWLFVDSILGYFEHITVSPEENYTSFVLAMIFDKEYSPLDKAVASTMLGCDSFIERIIDEYLGNKKSHQDVPALRELKRVERLDIISKEVKTEMGENGTSKKAAIYISHQHSGKSLKEIGAYFGISASGVSLASSRFMKTVRWNIRLRKNIEAVIKKLNL